MVAGDLLRLAWEAEHDGRTRLRDGLLTLAVAESGPGDHWVERCRARLVAGRPDHFLGHFATVEQALGDPRVVEARDRLRVKYPPARVQSLLLRARARRGPYLGRVESIDAMIEDLVGPSAEAENLRRDAAQASRGPLNRQRATRPLAWSLTIPSGPGDFGGDGVDLLPEPPSDRWEFADPEPPEQEFSVYYLTVLLAIAFLLATVQQDSAGPMARG